MTSEEYVQKILEFMNNPQIMKMFYLYFAGMILVSLLVCFLIYKCFKASEKIYLIRTAWCDRHYDCDMQGNGSFGRNVPAFYVAGTVWVLWNYCRGDYYGRAFRKWREEPAGRYEYTPSK